MASNTFGNLFKITTWGESHGKAIGVVIDGCPAGLHINEDEINQLLRLRAPGRSPHTSPRKESDLAEILSGVYEGQTTGAPISIIIYNQDKDSSKYEPIKDLLRPGHANYTYLSKYGIFDFRGGGRASARETACRVAASAIAKKLLHHNGIAITAYVVQIGDVQAKIDEKEIEEISLKTYQDVNFCPDPTASSKMSALIAQSMEQKDTLGGVVEFIVRNVPAGLGDPVYQKLEARLADAMLSIPAAKGFEIGSGFKSASMQGSIHNDLFTFEGAQVKTETNFSGGTLGGISNGMPLIGKVAFKPTSSIMKKQKTLTVTNEKADIELPQGSRHDPCVAIRAVPVVEAMAALVLVDALLLNRLARLSWN